MSDGHGDSGEAAEDEDDCDQARRNEKDTARWGQPCPGSDEYEVVPWVPVMEEGSEHEGGTEMYA